MVSQCCLLTTAILSWLVLLFVFFRLLFTGDIPFWANTPGSAWRFHRITVSSRHRRGAAGTCQQWSRPLGDSVTLCLQANTFSPQVEVPESVHGRHRLHKHHHLGAGSAFVKA